MPGKKNPHRGPGKGKPHAPRKAPPREATGEEARYLQQRFKAKLPLIVHMVSGEQHRGTVELFDREMVKVIRLNGPSVVVRKSDIRYMVEDRRDDA